MASALPRTNSGKVCDPFFLIMLLAVIVALGSSFVLRATVAGLRSPSAQAASSDAAPAGDKAPAYPAPQNSGR